MDDRIDVKALRSARNWTQDEMAGFLGLDRSTVSRLENGQAPSGPARRLLEQLARERPDAPAEAPGAAA